MPDTIQRQLDKLTHASVETIRELLLRGKRSIDEIQDLRQRFKEHMGGSDEKILYALTRHHFEEEVAGFLLEEILAHMQRLESQLGRRVSVKVAALDYVESVETISDRLELIHEDQLRQLVDHALLDELTGAFVRDFFDYRLAEEFERARRYEHPLSLIMLDIDNFKRYNDTHGHPAGDDVLRRIGQVVMELKRESDLFFRYGGEEFALLLPETDVEDATRLGQRLLREIPDRTEAAADVCGAVTVSLGVAAQDPRWTEARILLLRADELLYAAKRNGRARLETDAPPVVGTSAGPESASTI